MLTEAAKLFFGTLPSPNLRQRRLASMLFCLLWFTCVVAGMHATFLVLGVQALILLHTAASLIAGVIGPAAATRHSAGAAGEFPFGLSRVSVVIRFSACIFLVFGCLTTLVETLHKAAHHHTSNAMVPCVVAVLHLVLVFMFREQVLMTDRVVGRRITSDPRRVAQDEAALSGIRDMPLAPQPHRGSSTSHGHDDDDTKGGGAYPASDFLFDDPSGRRASCGQRFAALSLYLMPTVALVSYALVSLTHNSLLDVAASVVVACLFLREGLRQGAHILWLLLNNPIRDVAEVAALEDCMRAVQQIPGVVEVSSTNWWRVNAQTTMLLLRVRVVVNVDAAAVTRAVRRCGEVVANYVYVECAEASAPFLSVSHAYGGSYDDSHSHAHHHGHACEDDHHHHDHGHAHAHGGGQTHSHNPNNYTMAVQPPPPESFSGNRPFERSREAMVHNVVPPATAAVFTASPPPRNPYSHDYTSPAAVIPAEALQTAATAATRSTLPPPPSFAFGGAGVNPYITARGSSSSYSAASSLPKSTGPPNVFTQWRPPAQ